MIPEVGQPCPDPECAQNAAHYRDGVPWHVYSVGLGRWKCTGGTIHEFTDGQREKQERELIELATVAHDAFESGRDPAPLLSNLSAMRALAMRWHRGLMQSTRIRLTTIDCLECEAVIADDRTLVSRPDVEVEVAISSGDGEAERVRRVVDIHLTRTPACVCRVLARVHRARGELAAG